MTNDAQTLVLCVLAHGPKHGYAINAAIEQLTGERLGPGSLYGALTRLESKGLIQALEGEGRQQPVQITSEGREVLRSQLQTMARISSAGLAHLGLA